MVGISQEMINNLNLAVEEIKGMQNKIYSYTTKRNIAVRDLKNGGADRLSQDMFSFIETLKNIVAKT